MSENARTQIVGRGIPVPGNDIDTDRIIPARFLKTVTNEGLGLHAFEDARKHDPEHSFNQKVYEGASVLVGGLNFGCGSSREHAPESLKQWGIRAIVGGSFAEIFFGNSTTLGIPCVKVSPADRESITAAIRQRPDQPIEIDLTTAKPTIRCADLLVYGEMPAAARDLPWPRRGCAVRRYLRTGPARPRPVLQRARAGQASDGRSPASFHP